MVKVRMSLYISKDLRDRLKNAFENRERLNEFDGYPYDTENKLACRVLKLGLDHLSMIK